MQSDNSRIVFEDADELSAFVAEKSRTAATAAASNLIPMMLRHVAASLSSSSMQSNSADEDKVTSEVIAKIANGIKEFADNLEANPTSTTTVMAGDADS